jgi:phage/plasmid-associated DNA primase
MLLIPFNRVVPEAERDPNLAKHLIDHELPGIFNWAIAGYQRLVANQGFTDSATMRMHRDDYRDETTPVRRFLKEYTVLAEGAEVTSKELYDLYTVWAQLEGHSRQSHVTFGRDATAYFRSLNGVKRSHDRKRNKFIGVTLSPEGEQEISDREAEKNRR